MQKENDILSSDKNLWEKVFNAANKNSSMIGDGSNYGDFLFVTVEGAKNEFSADKSKRSRPALSRLKRSRASSRRSRKISLAAQMRRVQIRPARARVLMPQAREWRAAEANQRSPPALRA